MGCKISKLDGEPLSIIIKLPGGCTQLSRSYSSPSLLAGAGHVFKNPITESYHAVSLTSSTYGSLRLDSQRDFGGERSSIDCRGDVTSDIRNSAKPPVVEGHDPSLSASGRIRSNENVKPLQGANNKQVETINMWELMEGVEDEKAALKMLRGFVGRPRVPGHDNGKSSPRLSTTIHTVDDVDNVLDARGSPPTTYLFRRGSSLESVTPVRRSLESGLNSDKTIGKTTAMLQKRRAQAIQISQEVIGELDDLRRKNLSRSQEFNTSRRRDVSRSNREFNTKGRRDMCRSQELYTTGRRRDTSRSQEFNDAGRRDLSQSEDFDSIGRYTHIRSPDLDPVKRGNPFRNQEHDSRKSSNVVRSQDSFAKPPVAKPREVTTRRHSHHDFPRTVQLKDERKIAMSKPDIVLRSPMLSGARGHERQRVRPGQESPMPSAAINVESRLRNQAQPTAEPNTTLPKAAGPTMMNLDLSSSQVDYA